MVNAVEKVTDAQKNQASAQQKLSALINQANINWRNQAGSIESIIKQNVKYENELKKVRKELEFAIKAHTDVKGNLVDITDATIEFRKRELELKQAISENNRTLNAQVKEYQSAKGSMDEMNHTLGQMRNLYRQLSDEERDSDFGQNLQAQIVIIDKNLKDLDASIGNHHRKVGNYAGGIKEGLAGIRDGWDDLLSGNIKGALAQFTSGLDGLKEGILELIPAKVAQSSATNASATASINAARASQTNITANLAEASSSSAVAVAATEEAVAVNASAVASNNAGIAGNQAATGGMKALMTSIKGVTSAALSFIATPLGVAIMALVGIGLAAKEIWDYNESISESIKLTEQFTGVTGKSADAIRQRAQALTNTFKTTDFESNLKAAQKLVENFGISYDEAFDEVERGLARGGAANDEFFQSINEYPAFFKKAGYSAREFIDLINTGFASGVYNDKMTDAIKEADISLREQTKATKDALLNAFGAPFTEDILKRIRTGQTTVKDALNEIAQEAGKTALTEQQLAQLTADIFKSAGEDVGGAAKMFELMRESVESTDRPLTETEQHLIKLAEENAKLEKAMDSALKSDAVISFQKSWEIAWVKIQTGFFEIIKVGKDLYLWYDRISGRSESLGKIWSSLQAIGNKFSQVIDFISVTIQRLGEKFGLTGDEANGFLKIITYATDPIKAFDLALQAIVAVLEFAADSFITVSTYAEAFGRTIGQLATLDLSNLKSIGSNADDIKKENDAIQEQLKIQKLRAQAAKTLGDVAEASAAAVRSAEQMKADAAKEAQKAEEEAAKNAEKLAKEKEDREKKYAAEQKRRADEARKRAEEAFREEIAKNEALLEHYKLTNDQKLKFDESFLYDAVRRQKSYLDTLYRMELENAEKRAKISLEDALAIDINKRTAEQQKLINFSIQLEQQKANEIKAINDGLAKWSADQEKKTLESSKKNLELDLLFKVANGEDKKKAEEEYHNAVYALMLEHFEKITGLNEAEIVAKYEQKKILTEIEQQYLDLIAKKVKTDREKEEENRKDEYKKIAEETDEQIEYISNAIGYESQLREVGNAYKAMLYAKDFESYAEYEYKKIQLYAAVAGAAASIMGEQTVFGKALSAAQIGMNTAVAIMKAYADYSFPVATAFAVTIGTVAAMQINKLFSTKVPAPPKFNASFETGVTNSKFEGAALVDEAGPEIHLDKTGKIKSMGQNKPNIRQVKKGDTIIPAPISDRIKDIMGKNAMPDVLMSLELNGLIDKKDYDFSRLENKLDNVEKAISKKPSKSYINEGDFLIEVTENNGNTHQRFLDKIGTIKRTQSRLN